MSVAPFAQWKPLPAGVNHSPGGMVAWDGIILHIMEGTLDGSDSWFRNPQAQASAHFGIGKDGRVFQWVDTADKAWAQAQGNPRNISIENEGNAGDSLTAAQLERNAEILAWAHEVHGVPLMLNDDPNARGLGWHGMGGALWGGHTGCPGPTIKAQRPWIINRAEAILNPQPVPQPQPSSKGAHVYNPPLNLSIIADLPCPSGGAWLLLADGGIANMAGAPLLGNVFGKDYFKGRTAQRLEAAGDKYVIVATSGERYGPVF